MLNHSRVVILCNDDRLMLFRLTPVIGVIGMFAGGVGETQGDRGSLVFQQVALDTGKESILLGMNACSDLHGLTIGSEG